VSDPVEEEGGTEGARSRPAAPGSAADALQQDRYGGGSRRRRRDRLTVIIAGSALAAAGLGWGVWALSTGAVSTVSASDAGYQILDDTTVTVKYTLSAPPGQAVRCALQALSTSKSTIGWRVVDVPPSDQPVRTLSDTVRTVYRPTTGLVWGCWAA